VLKEVLMAIEKRIGRQRAVWLPSRVWSDAGQVIASAIAICPSKPRDVAINR
jgi:hypothetical protein